MPTGRSGNRRLVGSPDRRCQIAEHAASAAPVGQGSSLVIQTTNANNSGPLNTSPYAQAEVYVPGAYVEATSGNGLIGNQLRTDCMQ